MWKTCFDSWETIFSIKLNNILANSKSKFKMLASKITNNKIKANNSKRKKRKTMLIM